MIELFQMLGRILIDNKEAMDDLDDTQKKAESTSDKLKGTLGKIGEVGDKVGTFITDTLKDVGMSLFNTANEYQTACNQLQASTGATSEEMQEFSKIAKDIYTDNFGESFEDIANSMSLIKQQTNLAGEELKNFTENGYLLSDTFGIEIDESVRGVDALMKQFGITSDEAFNLLAQGCQNGLNKNGDLIDIISEYAPSFKNAGYTAQDMFNSLYQGASTGAFSIDSLGDAFKEMNIKIMDASADEYLEKLGFNAEEFRRKYSEGGESAAQLTQTMIDKLAEMDDAQERYNTGVGIFGTMWEDNGEQAILSLGMLDGPISTTIDSLSQINEIRYDDLGSAFEGIKRKLEVSLMTPIENNLLPLLNNLANSDIINKFLDGLQSGENIGKLFADLINDISTELTNIIPVATKKGLELMKSLGEGIKNNAPTLLNNFLDILTNLSQSILDNAPKLVEGGMELLKNLAEGFVNSLPTLIAKVPQIIINVASTITQSMPIILSKGIEIIWSLTKGIIQAIPTLIANIPKIFEAILSVWQAINWLTLGKTLISGITNGINSLGGSLISKVGSIFGNLKNSVSNIFNGIKSLAGNIWNGILQSISKIIGSIRSTITSVFNKVLSSVTKTFNSVKSAIIKPIEIAKNTIGNIIDKIKGFFNFKITWPKIPLPHFTVKPQGWKFSDLLKGKIPSLGIDWYKEGGIMQEPTAFGINGNNVMVGGEKGAEAILPLDNFYAHLDKKLDENKPIVDYDKLCNAFVKALKSLNLTVEMDKREVGKIIDEYNSEVLDLLEKGVVI